MSEAHHSDMPLPGAITLGDLLSTGARAVGQNFVAFFAITLLVQLPAFAMNIGLEEWMVERVRADGQFGLRPEDALTMNAASLVTGVVDVAFLFLTQAVLMHATVEFLSGRRSDIGASLRAGLSHVHVVLALAFLNTMAIGLGCIACVIPGIILMCVLYVAVPAAVVERLGPIGAMQRSADLTTGHRLMIFLVIFFMVVLAFTFNCGIALGFGDPFQPQQIPGANLSLPVRIFRYVLSTSVSCIVTMFQAAFAAVFYARVRGIRDGVDANAIADVFA